MPPPTRCWQRWRVAGRFGLNFIGTPEGELEFKPLVEERFAAACRRDHPLAKLRRVSSAQLAGYDYISVGRSSGNRVLLDQALAGVTGRTQAICEAQHVTTTLGLVEAGLGVAAVPSMAMPGPEHPLLVSVRLMSRCLRSPQSSIGPPALPERGGNRLARELREESSQRRASVEPRARA